MIGSVYDVYFIACVNNVVMSVCEVLY